MDLVCIVWGGCVSTRDSSLHGFFSIANAGGSLLVIYLSVKCVNANAGGNLQKDLLMCLWYNV